MVTDITIAEAIRDRIASLEFEFKVAQKNLNYQWEISDELCKTSLDDIFDICNCSSCTLIELYSNKAQKIQKKLQFLNKLLQHVQVEYIISKF